MPAGLALFVMVGALLLGLLLNAADIRQTAERQPFGWQRTIAVALIEPVHQVSTFLSLDRPRAALESAMGRESGLEPTMPPPSGAPGDSTTTSTTLAVTTTTLPGRRAVSEGEPLVMYIGGDSMVGQFGPMLQNRANRSGMVDSEYVYEFESGLSRPDFIDWPERLDSVREQLDPDVVVLYFGGNDAQAIYMPDGTWIPFDTPEWEEEYRRRVAEVMSALDDDGRWVYWMGMPIVQSDTFRPRVELMNSIYESVAEEHTRVIFVEAWSVFQGDDGTYSEYLRDESGDLVDMRLNDGVHYTTAGATRLAEVVYGVLAEDWDLPRE
ncbi:hypothetical protein BH23ACT5_BH23ACT5_00150 [soil metagenome]